MVLNGSRYVTTTEHSSDNEAKGGALFVILFGPLYKTRRAYCTLYCKSYKSDMSASCNAWCEMKTAVGDYAHSILLTFYWMDRK